MKTTKRNRKAILCLALVIVVVASLFAIIGVSSSAATVNVNENYTFSATKYYQFEKKIPTFSSYTFETEFWIDPAVWGNKRAYNFFGNWADSGRSGTEFNIELHNYGSLRLMSQNNGSVYFGSNTESNAGTPTDLRTYMKTDENGNPIFVKLTVTVDSSVGNAYMYVDGNKVGEILAHKSLKGKTYAPSTAYNHRLGLDYRNDTSTYFKGAIKNIAMYSYVRSDISDFGAAFAAPSYDDDGLMFAYDLTDLEVNGGYLNDYSKNNNKAVNPNWTAEGIGKTFTVNDDLHLVKDLDVMPQTFEAVVYAPKTIGRTGVIFGNYMGSPAALNFEIHNNGMATIHVDPDTPTGAYSTKIADVRNNEGFVHIVIVRERNADSGATYKLYVDGEYVTETVLANDKFDLDMVEVQSTYKFQLGGDSRSKNERWFQGNMKDVALYSEPLTAEEVYASYKNGVGTVKNKDNGLLIHYDMNNVETSDYVEDVSGNDYHVTQGGVPIENFNQGRGFSATERIYVQKKLEVMPKTYEALVYVPSDNRSGVILGNYGGSTCLNFEIHGSSSTPRRPSIYITDANGNTMDTKFSYSLTPNAWAHIVITHEVSSSGAVFTCYVNGEQVDSFTTTYSYAFDGGINDDNYLMLGGDCRSDNVQYYKGRIKNVALYSDVLTAEEIKELYNSGVDTDNASLILHYDLTKPENQTGTTIIDESGNGYNTGSGNVRPFFERTEAIGDYDYAFAVVGDTQKLMYKDATDGTDYASYIYNWIVANKDSKKIKLVMGVGDITDKNLDTEYALAKGYFEMLGNAGILYSITPGNHDMSSGKYVNYNKYFAGYGTAGEDGYIAPLASLTENITGYYGPIVNGVREEDKTQVTNYYIKTTIDGDNYIIFSFEYGAPDDVLAWAGEICDANKDYKAIITTHAYMYRDGTTLDAGDVVPPNKSDSTSDDHRNNGDMVWDKFMSKHENIVLVFSGHDPCPNVILRQDHGVNGNVVSQFLVDFQTMDTSLNYETGMVAMFYVSKDGNVQVEYISTYGTAQAQAVNPDAEDMLYKERNCFSFNLYNYEIPKELVTKYGIIPQQYENSAMFPFVIFNEKGECIGAESYLLDRVKEYNNEGALHVAKSYLSANTWENGSFGSSEKKAYIVLRTDYVMASNENYNNVAQIRGRVTIDLNGYTITTPNGKAMVTSTIKPWSGRIDPTIISFVNGTISVTNHAMIKFDAWDNTDSATGITTYVDSKIFSYTFENISFKVSENVDSMAVSYTQHSTTPTAIGNPDMSFINCTFDLTNAKEGMTLFNLGNGYVDTKMTVVGCEIVLGANNIVLSAQNDVSGGTATLNGSVTYDKANGGNYMSVTLPKGNALPTSSVNGGELVFVKVAQTEETETYRLRLAEFANVEYAPKMSITLASELVMNVYIPVNCTEMFTFNGVTYENLEAIANKKVTVDGNDYYLIKVALGSAEGAKSVELVAKVNVGDTFAAATFTFSIPKYATKLIANGNDVEKALAKDVLAYVKAAYVYFDSFNTKEEIASVAALIDSIIGADYTSVPVSSGATNTMTPVTSVTLNLDAKPSIRFYVIDVNVEFYLDGVKLNTVSGTDANGEYVELDVYAYALSGTITYGEGGSYHISDFLTNAAGTDYEALVMAFVKYTESAADYRISVVGK